MNFLKSIWNKLDGKKTWIGILIAVVYSGLVAQGVISRNESVEWVIVTITGVGVGHKIVKS